MLLLNRNRHQKGPCRRQSRQVKVRWKIGQIKIQELAARLRILLHRSDKKKGLVSNEHLSAQSPRLPILIIWAGPSDVTCCEIRPKQTALLLISVPNYLDSPLELTGILGSGFSYCPVSHKWHAEVLKTVEDSLCTLVKSVSLTFILYN